MPPKIPTSFVPHQQFSPQSSRPQKSGVNFFLVGALGILVLALVATALTFAYEKYLQSVRASKEATVAQEEKGIDQNTVESFVALSNRLSAANTILKNRVVTSQFFDLLESITLQGVSVTSVTLTIAKDRTATLNLAGTARNFNALAEESSQFAQQTLIKHAIFSGLNAAKDGTVAFTATADVDSKLLLPNGTTVTAPAASTVSTTSVLPSTPIATTTSPAAPSKSSAPSGSPPSSAPPSAAPPASSAPPATSPAKNTTP